MNFLKKICTLKTITSAVIQPFSTIKSAEQLSYNKHRLETLPNFGKSTITQYINPLSPQLRSKTFKISIHMQHKNQARLLKLSVAEYLQYVSMVRPPLLM